ncbi:isochorismatase family cysteine hydrolase [Fluviicola sp.]|uniref:cysteine hydrolase family protein n=1 Tax=Fluviicola sp. TaxID=1917219 RepID=UPI0031DF218B
MENTSLQSALLVMDFQPAILSRYPETTAIIPNVLKAIDHAREQQLPVFYIRVGFRAGAPEINPINKMFGASKHLYANVNPEDFMRLTPELHPREDEWIITKRRISAFAGNDLEMLFRAQHIQHLILAGVSTSGVVLSTVREAADKDYKLTVLSDCCFDGDPEVHSVLLNKVFPRQADVLTCSEWIGK